MRSYKSPSDVIAGSGMERLRQTERWGQRDDGIVMYLNGVSLFLRIRCRFTLHVFASVLYSFAPAHLSDRCHQDVG